MLMTQFYAALHLLLHQQMYADGHHLIYYNSNRKPREAIIEKQSGCTSTKSTTHNESLIVHSANGSRTRRVPKDKYLSGWMII